MNGSRPAAYAAEAALCYAANGWFIFPVPPETKRSYKSADHCGGRRWGYTNDQDEVRRDWERWPNAGIGLPTGKINGVVVIDVDTPQGHGVDGPASLRQLEAKYGPLPETRQTVSPSGSVHYWFNYPDVKIKSASKIGAGIDVQSDGRMVVVPPTLRNGVPYRWLNEAAIADMPAWLVKLTKERPFTYTPPPRMQPIAKGIGYAAAVLEYEIQALAAAANTTRNGTLNWASYRLHQFVASGELDANEVKRRLIGAATANGLVSDDGIDSVLATIRSGARAGLQRPHYRRAS